MEDCGMEDERVFGMSFAKVYPMLLAKAERKGRTKDESAARSARALAIPLK